MSVHDFYAGASSLKGITGILVPDWGGLYDTDVFRGDDKTVPGMPGQVGTTPVRDSYVFQIPFDLKGTTEATLQTGIAALRALFATPLFTGTRRLPLTAGPGYVDTSCNAKYLGLVWTDTSHALDISGVLSIKNLDGSWS